MDIDIRFPLFIFEPSKDYSDTFMWKLYEACRIKDSNCELLSRYIFDAVYRPPLRLMSQKGINGSFGFYDCESSLDLFRMSVDERKDPADGQEHPAYKVFVLSLWDIFYSLPYEYLRDIEDPDEYDEEQKRIRNDCMELRKRERANMLQLMREGEKYGGRMIISADWSKRNAKMIREAQENAGTVMIGNRSTGDFFEVYTGGEPAGRMPKELAGDVLVDLILSHE